MTGSKPGASGPRARREGQSKPGLIVLAAPSGGGKTSLVQALLALDDQICLSVSYTTRQPRPGEIDGQHYYFVDKTEFARLLAAGEFLEHATVFGHLYGTGRQAVEARLKSGCDVVLDIDWQGARQVRRTCPSCRTVFVLPPSLAVLRARLQQRGQDSEREIRRRMHAARAEISHAPEFDFIVINDDFDEAVVDLHAIIRCNQPVRHLSKRRQQSVLAELARKG